MKAEWPELRLEDVSELIVDCPHSTPEWTDDGVIVLRNQYIRNGRLDLSNPSYTNEDGYRARIKRAIPTSGDLVITREAPMGEVCLIPDGLRCCLGQRMVLVRANKKIIDPKYLLFVIQSPYLQHQISWNEGTGTTVSNIRIPNLKAFLIPTPPLDEQKAIAHILGALDDKIELNRQMNETLEAMAQALFKSWFVDFDPVIDNALAGGNEIPEPLQARVEKRQALGDHRKPLPAEIQSLFSDRFVFTDEMGWVPDGWEHVQISVLCEKIQNGGTPKRDNALYWENPSIPWLTSGEVRQNLIHKSENAISEAGLKGSSAKWLPELSTVVAMYGATAGQVALITQPMTTNQAICGLIPVKPYRYFNYLALERMVADLANQARGSAQQNISKKIIEETKTIKPSEQIIDLFTEEVESCFGKWSENIQQIDTLAGLRDTLLPKLLSGELRIPDAEKQVAEAV